MYDEPALIASEGDTEYLVVSDLHIGMEIEMSKKGVHLYNATDRMSDRIINIMKEFSLRNIIILGDVKNSILYPETAEIKLLKGFFKLLEGFNVRIIAGNHDAHLDKIIDRPVVKELSIGKFGFIHGNRKPAEKMMMVDYIISAHDHVAVKITDKNGAFYEQKAWAIYNISKKTAGDNYTTFNKKARLISMPAFNDLIMGATLGRGSKRGLNPLITNGIFNYKTIEVYNLYGQRISL